MKEERGRGREREKERATERLRRRNKIQSSVFHAVVPPRQGRELANEMQSFWVSETVFAGTMFRHHDAFDISTGRSPGILNACWPSKR